jgi:hypothetical protein
VGTRYYLRFTRLALILVVCLTVIPIVAIFALFITQSHADLENVNINVRVAPREPGNYGVPIVQPPLLTLLTPPKAGRSPRVGERARQTPAAPALNANAATNPEPDAVTRAAEGAELSQAGRDQPITSEVCRERLFFQE